MNILFYLVPKSEVMFLYEEYSLRQAMAMPFSWLNLIALYSLWASILYSTRIFALFLFF